MLFRSAFPDSAEIPLELPGSPLQSITSIKYYDTDGVQQTWSSSLYDVDIVSEPGRVSPSFGEIYPSTRQRFNAVEVEFVAGYGDAGSDIPNAIKHAMFLLIGEMYERREETIAGTIISTVPFSAKNLLNPYRIMGF